MTGTRNLYQAADSVIYLFSVSRSVEWRELTVGQERKSKSTMEVVRAADAAAVAGRVEAVGGKVVRTHSGSILVVELPLGVSVDSVGADEVEVRELSRSSREVTASWRRVVTA